MVQVVIVGAGHAGGSVAALLRQYGFDGAITLIGAEPVPPYQRPPLSKAWLKGEAELEGLLLRPEVFYGEQAIPLLMDQRVVAIDRAARRLDLADGRTLTYDLLILAQGSRARRLDLPGADRPELLELRTLADAARLKAALAPGRRLVVVGAGYVGLEAAASARAMGAEVTVLERADRVLARVASPELSAAFAALHARHGVEIRTGVEVSGFTVEGVVLSDGTAVGADAVLVGVGGLAEDDLARAAGLVCADGVVVDERGRTSDPAIFAIGDMTHRPIPAHGDVTHRLESVPNALEQAKQVAAAITGRAPPPPEVPWFWSDQYEVKLQIAGLPFGADRRVTRGNPASGPFSVFHLCGDRLVCVEAANAAPEFMMGRQLIAKGTPVDARALADPQVSMKAVARP